VRGNLVPDKRRDINGKLVTRYVRPAAEVVPLFTIPAPNVTVQKAKTAPTNAQTQEWELPLQRGKFTLDPELRQLMPNKTKSFRLTTNDVDAYSVASVLQPGNAVALMDYGIRTADEVIPFLQQHGLKRLLVDRSEVAEHALSRGIPASSYFTLMTYERTSSTTEAQVLDAAETHAMESLRVLNFHGDVLRGDISLEDIKVIGAERISNHSSPNDIRDRLWAIKSGDASYTIKQLKALVEKADEADGSVFESVELYEKFGFDTTIAFHNVREAYCFMRSLEREVLKEGGSEDTDRMLGIIRQHDEMWHIRKTVEKDSDSPHWDKLGYGISFEMYEAGIDPVTAWEGVRNGMTPSQILAVRDNGIAPSVSGGWL